jgi:hypothetical protein
VPVIHFTPMESTMAHTSFPGHAPHHDRRTSCFFAALLAAAMCMMGSLASGQPAGNLARECALHDLERVVELDRHRAAQDIAPDNLHAGFMAILRARETCDRDPAAALAIYDSILLGPTLATARSQGTVWGALD